MLSYLWGDFMKDKLIYYDTGKAILKPGENIFINISTEQVESHLHAHDFIEITYVASGEGVHEISKNEYNVSKGDLFIINYDIPHQFRSYDDITKPPLVVYNCIFKPEFIDYTLLDCKDFTDITHHFLFRSLFPDENVEQCDIRLLGKDCAEIEDIYIKMYNEYTKKEKGYVEILRAYVIELLVMVFRLCDINQHLYEPISLERKDIIKKVIEYMKDNYQEGVTLEELSAMAFLSKNYFCKLFKEVTKTTVSQYIQDIRIDKACELLTNTNKTILDISNMVGYKDIKFFNHVFKRKTGQTPGGYRKTK